MGLRIAALAIVYIAAARFGLMMDAVSGFATLVWPATGIALAAMLRFGSGVWPGVAIGALVANVWAGAPVLVACGIALGNTLEAVLGALALRRVRGFDAALDRHRNVVALATLAALLSTAVSASIGVASLYIGGVVPGQALVSTWRAWWLGDVIGDLVVAPLLLTWSVPVRFEPLRARSLELLALCASATLMTLLVFDMIVPHEASAFRQPYMIFPILIWAAVRFDQRIVTTTTFVVCGLAVYSTARQSGPFVLASLSQSLMHLQVFIAVNAVAALVLGAAIAERRFAERQAHAAVRVRNDFLSVASHELRTPLTALVLSLDAMKRLLARGGAAADPANIAPKVEKAVKVSTRLTQLIDGLLDVSRMEAQRFTLQRERCDLSQIARDVVDRFAEQAQRAGSQLRLIAVAPVLGEWDPLRLEQVATNLISNAIKYGSGRPIDVSVTATREAALLSVHDRGIGIADADRDRIFGQFERAAPAQNFAGLGLGLYITRRIIEAHGGSIEVTSGPTAGTLFTVELPLPGRHGANGSARQRQPELQPKT